MAHPRHHRFDLGFGIHPACRLQVARKNAAAVGMMSDWPSDPAGETSIPIYQKLAQEMRKVLLEVKMPKPGTPDQNRAVSIKRRAAIRPLIADVVRANKLPFPLSPGSTKLATAGHTALVKGIAEEAETLIESGRVDEGIYLLRAGLTFSTRLYAIPDTFQSLFAQECEQSVLTIIQRITGSNLDNHELLSRLNKLLQEPREWPRPQVLFAAQPAMFKKLVANPDQIAYRGSRRMPAGKSYAPVLRWPWTRALAEAELLESLTEIYQMLPKSIHGWPERSRAIHQLEMSISRNKGLISEVAADLYLPSASLGDLICQRATARSLTEEAVRIAAKGKPWRVPMDIWTTGPMDPYSIEDKPFILKKVAGGFTLYSVGKNESDDQGDEGDIALTLSPHPLSQNTQGSDLVSPGHRTVKTKIANP